MYKPLKTPTTFQQQISILQSRNILVSNTVFCETLLSQVNYYRLSGYILPFVHKPDEKCFQTVSIEQLYSIYSFDAELRTLLSSIIEKIEIYLRTQTAYYFAHNYGADGYMDANNYNYKHDHVKFIGLINKTIQENRKSPVVHHHIVEYGGKFPIWVIIDFFTLGMLSHFYTDMKNPDKSHLATSTYRVNYQVLSSWLRCLTDLRNRCAHYSRLYYWIFPAVPKIPTGDSFVADHTLFSQLYMLKHMYPNKDRWNDDLLVPLTKLFLKYKGSIKREHLGFPYRWRSILRYK